MEQDIATLSGGGSSDYPISGASGNDSLRGNGCNDTIYGWTGSDTLRATEDNANIGFCGNFDSTNSIEFIAGRYANTGLYSVDENAALLEFSAPPSRPASRAFMAGGNNDVLVGGDDASTSETSKTGRRPISSLPRPAPYIACWPLQVVIRAIR